MLREVCETLDVLGVAYALVGGLGVSARADPRLTRDVDLAIGVDNDAAAEALVRDLMSRGYRVESTVEQSRTGRLATVRLEPPGRSGLVVDLLFASCGIEDDIVQAAEPLEVLPGMIIDVATSAHLIAMKLLARDDRERPQDLDDLRHLIPTLGKGEREHVVAALRKIEQRGFSRGRDLLASWRLVYGETMKPRSSSLRRVRRPVKPKRRR